MTPDEKYDLQVATVNACRAIAREVRGRFNIPDAEETVRQPAYLHRWEAWKAADDVVRLLDAELDRLREERMRPKPCKCGECRECYRNEEWEYEGREIMREYRVAKDGGDD